MNRRSIFVVTVGLFLLLPLSCNKVEGRAVKALINDFFTALQQENEQAVRQLMPEFDQIEEQKRRNLFKEMNQITGWEVKDITTSQNRALADVVVTTKDGRFVITINIMEKNDTLFVEKDLTVRQYYDIIPAQQGGE